LRVVWGRLETIETLSPTSALTRVDLPALARPNTPIAPNFFAMISLLSRLA